MKESIHIKNLGPIKDIFIDDIKPITVLIGESGSGKSTLMKAIALFRWIYKMHNIRSYLKRSKISKSPFRFRMDTYFKNCGFEQYIKNNPEIIYTVEFAPDRKYTLQFSKNKLTGTGDQELIQGIDLQYHKLSFISETRNIIPLWADRGASLTGAYLGFYFHEVYNDFDLASESLKEMDISYLKLKLAVKKVHSHKKFLIQEPNNEYEIDLKNSSSGTQNAIPVSLIAEHFSKHFNFEEAFNRSLLNFLSKTDNLTDFKPVKNLGDIQKKLYIHIEEPELSLYPDAQCELISDLNGDVMLHTVRGLGMANFSNKDRLKLTIINYDKFVTSLPHPFQNGRKRCDIILCSETNRYFILGELKDRKHKSKVRSGAKKQLIASLQTLMDVYAISDYVSSKETKRCCYFNKQSTSPEIINATSAFNR